MSYVHFVDQHESGRLTDFCKRLSGEVQMQTGLEFPIFQDRKDIAWGQQWRERVNESLDAVTFLIPILTASFFKSEHCRNELARFLDREKQLNRNDLILPVYYVDSAVLNVAAKEDNEIFANTFSGVEIKTGGDPTVRGNRISKNAYQAIYVHESGGGLFQKNDLRGNPKGAWNISTDSLDKVKLEQNLE
jgi:parallel beta-helix repeat protein